MKKSRIAVTCAVTVAVAAAIAGGSYWLGTQSAAPSVSPTPTQQRQTIVEFDIPADEPTGSPAPAAVTAKPAVFETKFYDETTTQTLAPRVAEEFCPDFEDYTEASPVTFGAERYRGRMVTVSNAELLVEIYLTPVDGGVWAAVLSVAAGDPNGELETLRAELAEWMIPEESGS